MFRRGSRRRSGTIPFLPVQTAGKRCQSLAGSHRRSRRDCLRVRGDFASSASIATANADKAAERTACRISERLAEVPIRRIGDHARAPGGFVARSRFIRLRLATRFPPSYLLAAGRKTALSDMPPGAGRA